MTVPKALDGPGRWVASTTDQMSAIGSSDKLETGDTCWVEAEEKRYVCDSVDGANSSTWSIATGDAGTADTDDQTLAEVLAQGNTTGGADVELSAGDAIVLNQNATVPGGNPSAGKVKIWLKSDGTVNVTDENGTDTAIGSGGGDVQQVKRHMSTGVVANTVVAFWDMSGDLTDDGPNSLDLSVTAGTLAEATIAGVRGIMIPGGHAGRASNDAALTITGAITVHVLVYGTATPSTTARIMSFVVGGETEATNGIWDLSVDGTPKTYQSNTESGSGADNFENFNVHYLLGSWNLLTYTRSSGGTRKLYIDGVLAATGSNTTLPTGGTSSRVFESLSAPAAYAGLMVLSGEESATKVADMWTYLTA